MGNNAFTLKGQIGVDLTPLEAGLRQANTELGSFSGLAAHTGEIVAGMFSATVLAGAVNYALQLGKMGADSLRLEASFHALAQAPDALIKRLKAASGETVSTAALMLDSNRSVMLGLGSNVDKMSSLMAVARFSSKALGDTTEETFASMVQGIGRLSPRMLESVGLAVDAGEADRNYALALGRTAASLSEAEQRQALLNNVLEVGQARIKASGGIVDNVADSYERLTAAQADLAATTGKIVAPFTGELVSNAANFAHALESMLELSRKYGAYKMLDIWGGAVFGGGMPTLPPEPSKMSATLGWESGFAPVDVAAIVRRAIGSSDLLGGTGGRGRMGTMAEPQLTWGQATEKFGGDPDKWNTYVRSLRDTEVQANSGASSVRILAADTRTLADVARTAAMATGGWATEVSRVTEMTMQYVVGAMPGARSEADIRRDQLHDEAAAIRETQRAGAAYWRDMADKAREAQDKIQGFITFQGSPSYRGGLVGTAFQTGNAWDERARRIEDIGNLGGKSPWAAGETGWQGLNDAQRQAWAQMQAANIRERPSIPGLGPEGINALTQDAISNVQAEVDKKALYERISANMANDPATVANLKRLGIDVKDAFAEPADKITGHIDDSATAIVAAVNGLKLGGGDDKKNPTGPTPPTGPSGNESYYALTEHAAGGVVGSPGTPIPILAHRGESIFNGEQQRQLLALLATQQTPPIDVHDNVFKVDNPRGFLDTLNGLIPSR